MIARDRVLEEKQLCDLYVQTDSFSLSCRVARMLGGGGEKRARAKQKEIN